MPDPNDTDDRTPPPDPLGRRVLDALGWFLAVVVSNFVNVGHTWRCASPRERSRLVGAGTLVFSAVVVASISPWWNWLLVAALVFMAIVDLDDVAGIIAERQKTLRLLSTMPTGAPRVAEIRCSRGAVHRFIYGPGGWEEAGPAQHPANA